MVRSSMRTLKCDRNTLPEPSDGDAMENDLPWSENARRAQSPTELGERSAMNWLVNLLLVPPVTAPPMVVAKHSWVVGTLGL